MFAPAAILALASALPLVVRVARARGRSLTPSALCVPAVLYAVCVVFAVALQHLRQLGHFARPTSGDLGEFSAASLVLYGYGLIAPGVALLVAVPWLVRRGSLSRAVALGAVSLSVLGVSVWALYVEPAMVVERHYHLRSPRAPAGGLVILHLSDLQTDGPCRRETLALRAIAAHPAPDLVIFTGDYSNGPDVALPTGERERSVREFLSGLHARYGVWGVWGDWDYFSDYWHRRLASIVSQSPLRILDGGAVTLDVRGTPVTVYGIDEFGHLPVTGLSALRGYRIVMAHHPDRVIERLVAGGADLALAGHTHGGQVSLPFIGAPVVHNGHGFTGGIYHHEGIPLVISRGLGVRGGAAPRVRFGVPPEISWITVTR